MEFLMAKKKVVSGKSARVKAFLLIEEMLMLPSNVKKLKAAFQESFNEDPVMFYKQFIKPTAEKEIVVSPEDTQLPVGVRILYYDNEENNEEV